MIRFGLLGIPVTVQWWFWLTAALLSRAIGSPDPDAVFLLLAWMGVAFVSVLWHELGHALAFRRIGRASEIVLQAFGGQTVPQRGGKLSRKEDLLVTMAGPGFGFLLWLALYGSLKADLIPSSGHEAGWGVMVPAATLPGFVRRILFDLQFVNLWWSVLNLIPVAPLDGGRILAAGLGPKRAREAVMISVICGGTFALLAILSNQMFLAILLGWMTFENSKKLQSGWGGRGLFGGRL